MPPAIEVGCRRAEPPDAQKTDEGSWACVGDNAWARIWRSMPTARA